MLPTVFWEQGAEAEGAVLLWCTRIWGTGLLVPPGPPRALGCLIPFFVFSLCSGLVLVSVLAQWPNAEVLGWEDPCPACSHWLIPPCPWGGTSGVTVCGRLCLPRDPSSQERPAAGSAAAQLCHAWLCPPPSSGTSRAGNLLGSAVSLSSRQQREELNHNPGDQPASHGRCLQQSQTSRFCCPLCPLEGGIPSRDRGAYIAWGLASCCGS